MNMASSSNGASSLIETPDVVSEGGMHDGEVNYFTGFTCHFFLLVFTGGGANKRGNSNKARTSNKARI